VVQPVQPKVPLRRIHDRQHDGAAGAGPRRQQLAADSGAAARGCGESCRAGVDAWLRLLLLPWLLNCACCACLLLWLLLLPPCC
jgi:hypothetical protein